MGIVRELAAKLGLDFEAQGFLKAQVAFEVLRRGFDAAVQVLEGVADALVETAEKSEHLDHLAQRTGISTQALQELEYAAGRSDVSLDEMAASLGQLGKSALAAKNGSEESAQAFRALGVSVTDGSGKLKGSEELLLELADAFASTPDGLEKTALAMKVFGRSGASLIPVLNGGREGLEELRTEAHEFGLVMGGEVLESGQGLNAVLEQSRAMWTGLKQILAGPFLQPLREIGEEFVKWRKENAGLIRQRLEAVAKALAAALRGLLAAVRFVVRWFDLLLVVVGALALAIKGSLIPSLVSAAGAFLSAGAAGVAAGLQAAAAWVAAAAPVVLMAAIIAAMVLAAEDVYTFLQGGDSLIGDIGPKWTAFLDEFLRPTSEDPWWLASLKQLGRLITDLQGEFPKLVADWKYVLDEFVGWVREQVARLPGASLFLGEGQAPGTVGSPALAAPLVSSAAAGAGATVLSRVEMPVTIQASAGQDPQAIAAAVGQVVDERIRGHLQEAAAATQ